MKVKVFSTPCRVSCLAPTAPCPYHVIPCFCKGILYKESILLKKTFILKKTNCLKLARGKLLKFRS